MDRRTFLKIAAMGSLAFVSACSKEDQKHLFTLIKAPDDLVTGKAHWYASTCRECPAGCGVLAKNREDRIVKLEGNPLHPINRGKLCMRGQAALQGIYNPDRLKTALIKEKGGWLPVSYQGALNRIKAKINQAVAIGPDNVCMISEVEGPELWSLFEKSLSTWQSSQLLAFEPFAYENLKKANEVVFNTKGIARYHIDQCDFLLGFGADFLETWLSPVEYARQFKEMHGFQNKSKGMFVQVSPYRSLTGANADEWIGCAPGSELIICMGLIREALIRGKGANLPASFKDALTDKSQLFTIQEVVSSTGISKNAFDRLADRLMTAKKPLILGTGSLSHSPVDLQTNIAVNLLNYVLDSSLSRIDFVNRHRIEKAATRSEILSCLKKMIDRNSGVLLLNNINPVHTIPPSAGIKSMLESKSLFVVQFANFLDETSQYADVVLPVSLPLESWGTYNGHQTTMSCLQPAMKSLYDAPHIGDVFLQLTDPENKATFKHHLFENLKQKQRITTVYDWLDMIRQGGQFTALPQMAVNLPITVTTEFSNYFSNRSLTPNQTAAQTMTLIGLPSIRFFDGRSTNRPWLWEIPDPLTKVAWQAMALMHPETAGKHLCSHGDIIQISSKWGGLTTPVYVTEDIVPGLIAIHTGQGHTAFGRYARNRGVNVVELFAPDSESASGDILYAVTPVDLQRLDKQFTFAHTDGSKDQLDRKIALAISIEHARQPEPHKQPGLSMEDFPLTLPLPEGYDPKRDFYPPHDHVDYRWAMIVDLDRCIGCNACSAACYAENNIGIVGEKQIINGREMSWIRIERYRQTENPDKWIFLPMLCQHCDNAPCESVCPVYAPHHSKEGINNQIYNRCIGTRFCAQNCPYKVRRFNWFTWPIPKPMNLQLNPEVTVRSKGVMEKCSFCVQRIKDAHGLAKDEKRMIKDGEVIPACAQTCPTHALTFGSLMDKNSRVTQMVKDRRAYQVMGYLNTKPAVIYLKKVVQTI